jgi:hypothetical protein
MSEETAVRCETGLSSGDSMGANMMSATTNSSEITATLM